MKKKFCALLCVLVGTVSLVGCGSSSATKGEEYVTEDSSDSGSLSSATASIEASSASSSASYDVNEIAEPTLESSTDSSSAASVDTMTDDGINIVFIGDSQFDNARDSGTSIAELVAENTGATVYNLGIGGTSASVPKEQRYSSHDQRTDPNFVGITYALAGECPSSILDGYAASNVFPSVDPSKVDYYVVEYGVNDYFNGAQIYDQSDSNNVTTYVSALQQGLMTLNSISPNAKIMLMSPAYSMFYNASGTFIGDGNVVDKGAGTLSDYASACENLATDAGVPMYIDAYYGGTFDLDQYTADVYLSDGIHFTETGRHVVAAAISKGINADLGVDTSPSEIFKIEDFQCK